jgi:REP element-mobilizing transposase RayT
MNKIIPTRKNLRLPDYDYALPGGYFVTIAGHQRGNVFGVVEDGEVGLNPLGRMICACWSEIPDRFDTIQLDEYILMPDHFHAVLFITEPDVGAGLVPAREIDTKTVAKTRATTRVAPTLGMVIGAFKSISTNRYISGVKKFGWKPIEGKLWQRGYYDRIIRNQDELKILRNYVISNATKQEPPDFLDLYSEVTHENRT